MAAISEESQMRKNLLYLQHPDPSPDRLQQVDYLMHAPSRLAATAVWVRYRDETLIPLMASSPDDPNLPLYAARAEEILKWRASVPPEDRFWRPDE